MAKARTGSLQYQCSRACAARQSRPVSGELGVMSRRTGTKGLRGNEVHIGPQTPSGDVWSALHGAPASLAGSIAAKADCLEEQSAWRQTDDAHSTCVLRRRECAAEVVYCRHYVLGQCTDETSANNALSVDARRLLCAGAGRKSRLSFGRVSNTRTATRLLLPGIFLSKRRHRGWPQQPHLLYSVF